MTVNDEYFQELISNPKYSEVRTMIEYCYKNHEQYIKWLESKMVRLSKNE